MSDLQSEPKMASPDSLGPYLKKSRETQGLSLDQVASLTRIQAKFLQALEDEEFQSLPEQVFTRGFVRTYARSLGLDEEDTLRRFSESSSEYYQQGQQAQYQAHVQIEEEKRSKLNRNLVIIVTIIIIVALGFLLPRQQQSSPPPPSPDQENMEPRTSDPPNTDNTEIKPEAPDMTSTPEEVEDMVMVKEPSPEINTVPTPDSTPTPVQESSKPLEPAVSLSTDPLRLEIEATQLTWVVVKSDNDSPQEALLQPGQLANWEAQQQFTLTLGNAAGVAVRLNGESRGPFGKPGEVVREVVLKP